MRICSWRASGQHTGGEIRAQQNLLTGVSLGFVTVDRNALEPPVGTTKGKNRWENLFHRRACGSLCVRFRG